MADHDTSLKINENVAKINNLITEINSLKLSKNQKSELCKNLQDTKEIITSSPRLFSEFKSSFSARVKAEEIELATMDEARGAALVASIQFEICSLNILMVQYEKTYELSTEFLTALADKKVLIASMIARALHEMSAFTCYLSKTIDKKLSTVERQVDEGKIIKELEATVKFLEKAFYGSSSKATGISHIDIKHGRDELRKIWGDEKNSYDRLCDYVHPNYGSNVIYGSGNLSELSGEKINEVTEDQIVFLAKHFILVVDQAHTFLNALAARSVFFTAAQLRLKEPNFKVQNLFKPRKVGKSKNNSGKSFETAIDLSKLPHIEIVPAIYHHLEKKGLTFLSRNIDRYNENFYDVVQTNKGKYFFKVSS